MRELHLSTYERHQLYGRLRKETDVRRFRQILALLEVAHGRSASDVARMLHVHRSSVYEWINTRQKIVHPPRNTRLLESRGRSRALSEDLENILDGAMEYDPEDLGYTSTVWTVPLLRKHLKLTTGAIVSDDTLRRYLHEQGEHWKRPRYTLDPDSYKAKKSG